MGENRRGNCIKEEEEISQSLVSELGLKKERVYELWKDYVSGVAAGINNNTMLRYMKLNGFNKELDYFALVGLKIISEDFLK